MGADSARTEAARAARAAENGDVGWRVGVDGVGLRDCGESVVESLAVGEGAADKTRGDGEELRRGFEKGLCAEGRNGTKAGSVMS